MSCETLAVYPDEIQFLDVRPNQTYIQTVEIKNVLQSTCSFRIRPSNTDRISVEPSTLSLAPGETKRVQVHCICNMKFIRNVRLARTSHLAHCAMCKWCAAYFREFLQVKLKLQGKMLPKKKGGAAYRDTVQLKSDFFEKKFSVSFQPVGPPDGTRDDKENRDATSTTLQQVEFLKSQLPLKLIVKRR